MLELKSTKKVQLKISSFNGKSQNF